MSKFKDLFKRKPGGTTVGNLLRAGSKIAVNAFAPGAGALVGNGAMMISEEDASARDGGTGSSAKRIANLKGQMSDAYGNAVGAASVVMPENAGAYTTDSKKLQAQQIWQKIKIPTFVVGGIAVLGISYKLLNKGGSRKSRR